LGKKGSKATHLKKEFSILFLQETCFCNPRRIKGFGYFQIKKVKQVNQLVGCFQSNLFTFATFFSVKVDIFPEQKFIISQSRQVLFDLFFLNQHLP
jgi:hypothetical protein